MASSVRLALTRPVASPFGDSRPAAPSRRVVEEVVQDDASDSARDARLVEATLSGERRAFGELVSHYQKRVYALAFRYVGNEADAADLTQRAFLQTFEQLARLRRAESFAAWLFRSAANLAKNEIRFQATRAHDDVDVVTLSTPARAETRLDARAERDALREALADLPDKQRRCVLLRIDAELSFKAIGDAVGCSEGSARVNFHHGLKALKRKLAPNTAPLRAAGQERSS